MEKKCLSSPNHHFVFECLTLKYEWIAKDPSLEGNKIEMKTNGYRYRDGKRRGGVRSDGEDS